MRKLLPMLVVLALSAYARTELSVGMSLDSLGNALSDVMDLDSWRFGCNECNELFKVFKGHYESDTEILVGPDNVPHNYRR
jgi:hypothetical protein